MTGHLMARWARAATGSRTAIVIAGAVFVVFAVSVGRLFLAADNIENICRQISLDAPVAFGETIVLIAGGIDISVGAVMAMAAALAIGLQPYGAGLASLAALAFGLGIGLLNGLLVTKGRIVSFVSTLGTMSFVRGLLLTYTHQQPLVGENAAFTWWGGGGIGPVPTPFVVALLLTAGSAYFSRACVLAATSMPRAAAPRLPIWQEFPSSGRSSRRLRWPARCRRSQGCCWRRASVRPACSSATTRRCWRSPRR